MVRRHQRSSSWTYPLLDELQSQIYDEIQEGHRGALLVSELAPVITLGRRQKGLEDHFGRVSDGAVPVWGTDRGGRETYHGTGQWVLFPVDRMNRMKVEGECILGAKCLVSEMLRSVQKVLMTFDVKSEIREGSELGLWTSGGKVASIGIRLRKGVVMHGVSVNGYRNGNEFGGIQPCGLSTVPDYVANTLSGDEFSSLGRALTTGLLRDLWAWEGQDEAGIRAFEV